MKKITLTALLALVTAAIISGFSGAAEIKNMTDKIIRIHVIANSDSECDQRLKLSVRDGILEAVGECTAGARNKGEAMKRIELSLGKITEAAKMAVRENGGDCDVYCTLRREEFDARVYDGFTLPAGEYDSLCIRLGKAEGHNWWCVCYPSLCVGTAVKIEDCGVFTDGELTVVTHPEKVRYKLWCFEVIRKIAKVFKKD